MNIDNNFRLAMEIGIPYETFWKLTPYEFEIMLDAHRKQLRQKNTLMWLNGVYVWSALNSSIIGNSSLFRGKHGNKEKYMEEPLHIFEEEKILSEEEKISAEQKLLLSLEAMQRSFEANKK